MWKVYIAIYIGSIVVFFFVTVCESSISDLCMTPNEVYKDTEFNMLGCVLIFISLLLFNPIGYLLRFLNYLLHVGRENDFGQ